MAVGEGVLDFFHQQLPKAVKRLYLKVTSPLPCPLFSVLFLCFLSLIILF